MRVYLGDGVPVDVRRLLERLGCDVIPPRPEVPGYFRRFAVLEDPTIDRFLCRDTDCRITEAEVAVIDAMAGER